MYWDLAESRSLVMDQSNLLIIKSKMQINAPMVDMIPWTMDITFSFQTYCFRGERLLYPKRAKSFLLRNRLRMMFTRPKHTKEMTVII